MDLVRRILKRGVYAYDPNSLHLFERMLLEAVEKIETHNILFMSVQAQLRSILSLQTKRMGCAPDWLRREYRNGCIVVKQQRFVR